MSHYYDSDINDTASSTHGYDFRPSGFENMIISKIIYEMIWHKNVQSWNSAKAMIGRELTPVDVYTWINQNPGELRNAVDSASSFHGKYLKGSKNPLLTKNHIEFLKEIVEGRKIVLDKYQKATRATQHEIEALKQMLQLPDDVRDWLKTQELTEEDEKILFNLIESADSSSGSSADAGGRRRRKTSFRRRRMSRYRSSKSKSKSKKSRKSRKCVR